MDAVDIIGRFDSLAASRTTVQQEWEDVERYVSPHRGKFLQDDKSEHSVQWNDHYRFDSTAVTACQNLSSNIHGALTSPSVRWFALRYRDEKLNKNKQASMWLESVGDRLQAELQDSNFDSQINEVYQDLTAFGTGFLTLEEMPGQGWTGFNFSSVPIKEGYFEEDFMGRVLRFYRKLQWTPQKIMSKFGDKTPQKIKDLEADGNTEKLDVLFVIVPRGNKIASVGQRMTQSRRPWEYGYILKDDATIIETGGYYEQIAFAPRWGKTSMSVWGFSPATLAMGDIKSANAARRLQLSMAEKMIDPPVFAEEMSILADLDMSSGGLNVVRRIDGIEVFNAQGSIPVSDHMITQLQDAIKDYFFTDQLQFPRPQGTPMSATEAQIRYEQLAKLMAPTLGRLQNDMLSPIVARGFKMLVRSGELDPPPESVVESGGDLDIEYLGSLARAQKTDRAAATERLVASVANISPVFPNAVDVIDDDAMVRELARDLNISASILRDDKEVTAMREDREAKMQAMQEAQIAEQQGNAAQAQQAAQQEQPPQ